MCNFPFAIWRIYIVRVRLHWFVSSQFQLVADLFHEKDDVASSKSSRINVRAAKSTPKTPNKDHRKTVGHQVGPRLLFGHCSHSNAHTHVGFVSLLVSVPQLSSSPDGDSECYNSSLCPLYKTQRWQGSILVSHLLFALLKFICNLYNKIWSLCTSGLFL